MKAKTIRRDITFHIGDSSYKIYAFDLKRFRIFLHNLGMDLENSVN